MLDQEIRKLEEEEQVLKAQLKTVRRKRKLLEKARDLQPDTQRLLSG